MDLVPTLQGYPIAPLARSARRPATAGRTEPGRRRTGGWRRWIRRAPGGPAVDGPVHDGPFVEGPVVYRLRRPGPR